ncbi:MAG: alpha/beta fold hydrolase [Myxococcaceae bacterium]
MRRAVFLLGTLLWSTLSLAAPPPARPSVDSVIDDLNRTVHFRQVALSPDGARVAWVESVPEKEGPAPDRTLIQVADRASPEASARRITASADATALDETGIAWSPDGKQLAFLSNAAGKEQPQLFVADVSTGSVRKLTSFQGSLSSPRWSPDGKTLAVLVIEGTTAEKGPTGPASRQTGVVDELAPARRLALVNAADGHLRVLSPANLFIHEFAWSPDSQRFAAIASPPPGDANWWTAKLYTLEVGPGATRVVHAPRLQIAEPTWSPDGKQLAFIEGLMSDEDVNGGDVFVLPATGGTPRNLTPDLKASAVELHWPSLDKLLFVAHSQGELAVVSVHPARGALSVLWKGAERISAGEGPGLSLARDGVTSAVLKESFSQPPEVYAGSPGAWVPLTHRNAGVKSPAGPVKSITWKSDGFDVQGWLLAPLAVKPGEKHPMIVLVHGGPSSAAQPTFEWKGTAYDFVAHGYYVFMPNPRGSFGQGQAFTRANVKDFGGGDLKDILAGVDAVERQAPIDDKRLGVYGHSYGGFMTMWTVTHSQRFKAAVAGAGIADWVAYYGQNGIDQWMVPFFGTTAYKDPAAYDRFSPIRYIAAARTPTFLYVGERDVECPADQSLQFHAGLDAMGVPNSLVIYAGEGHGIREAEHKADLKKRILDWFDRYLGQP